MTNDETKGKGRVLTFVVTSALLSGPAALVGVGCGPAEGDYVNTPAPEPLPVRTNAPAEEPEPDAVAPDAQPTEPTNVPPAEAAADAESDTGRTPRPSTRPPSHRTNNAPASRHEMSPLENL
jgi:hypothetical protein